MNPHFRFDSTKGSAICNMCGTKFQIEETVDKTNINSSEIQTEGVIDFVVKEKKYVNKRTDIVKVVLAIETGLFIYESGIL